jgi:hypothetical protein
MDKARDAINSFMSKAGQHDTSVHENVAPGVTRETVHEQRREERQKATDREVHQDHYHTTIQPVKDRAVLPEQHHHNMLDIEHRNHDHRNPQQIKQKLHNEAAQFRDKTTRAPVEHTSTTMTGVSGEHVHHHVHEIIQPVVEKEVIEPHVVHTTVPVHEVHHNPAQHHTASTMPTMSMAEFKKQGGSLTGRDERVDHFSGEPKSLENHLGNSMKGMGSHNTMHGGHNAHHAGLAGTSTAMDHEGMENKLEKMDDSHPKHSMKQSKRDRMASNSSSTGDNFDSSMTDATSLGSSRTSGNSMPASGNQIGTDPNMSVGGVRRSSRKASLIDKINPMKDADGDGKKGFMK